MRPLILAPALVLLLALALGAAACGEPPEPRDAQVEDFRLVQEPDGTQAVRGEVHNPSGRPIQNLQIEVALYAEEADISQPTETMRVQVRNVGPGERVPFRQEIDSGVSFSGARVQSMLLR